MKETPDYIEREVDDECGVNYLRGRGVDLNGNGNAHWSPHTQGGHWSRKRWMFGPDGDFIPPVDDDLPKGPEDVSDK